MSGGSYNYLCHKDASQICGERGDIQSMHARLLELGHGEAAKYTIGVLDLVEELERRLEVIKDVWKAVEWCDSCDWDEESVDEAIAAFGKIYPSEMQRIELKSG